MNFALTSEQEMLKDSVEKFLQQNYDFDTRRKLATSELGYRVENWKIFAEFGWLSVPFAEENQGFGGGMVDGITMTQALGRALVTEPFVANLILGGRLIETLGNSDIKHTLLPELIDGNLQLALAHSERHSGGNPACVGCRIEQDGSGYLIHGEKILVLNGANADKLLVTARISGAERDRSGVVVILVDGDNPGITRRGYATVDGMRAADIRFDNLRVPSLALLGNPDSTVDTLEQVLDEAIVAFAAEAVGAMEVLISDTIEYAKTRKQFGQPISKFQALQFRIVDMWLAQQKALSALQMAAIHQDEGGLAAKRSASALKVTLTKASRFIGEQAIQIHAGIGTSDELRVGHYFKRLLCIESLLGGMDHHLDRYANLMEAAAD